MLSFRLIFITGFLAYSLLCHSYASTPKAKALQKILVHNVLNHHYQPISIKDDYSKDVFDTYIKQLDPNKRFFTQTNIAQLSLHKYSIDNYLENNAFTFMEAANAVYQKQLLYIESIMPELLDTPFTFTSTLSLETDMDKRDFSKNNDQLKAYWKKLIIYQTLTHYINLKQSDVTGNVTLNDTFNKDHEQTARNKTKKEMLETLKRLKDENAEDRRHLYLNSLIAVFDTHTNYFPADRKEDFDINISGKLEGIGAVLREEDGFIKVIRIVPGSASWKQGDLKAEDQILKVAQGDDKDSVDIVGARVRDAVKLIRGKKGSTVRLTVKHPSGDIQEISIVRDVVVIEETYTKHAIITDKRTNANYGYIHIPKFYRDFKNPFGRNTTSDVEAALKTLSQSNVDGIILDLRNNEGGALVDAVHTAGLFIDEGPIVQVNGRKPKIRTILKDKNPSNSYAGPLVILINHYSASASEILAAALQDYRRAVIVGSPSFGKGTVQTFIDLDRINPAQTTAFKPLGSLKLTIQKFYRINGGSTQHKGVEPDIKLPDLAQHLDVGERHLDFALPWDTIKPLRYDYWQDKSFDLHYLRKKSNARIKNSAAFTAQKQYMSFIKKQTKNTKAPLNATLAINKKIITNKKSKLFKDSQTNFDDIDISIPHKKSLSDSLKSSYEDWTKSLKKDAHIRESCAILTDLITLQNKASENISKH